MGSQLQKVMEIGFVPLPPKAISVAAASRLPNGAQLRLISTTRGLAQIGDAWRALEQTCHVPPTVFQSYDWLKCWADTHVTPEGNVQLFLVVGYIGNRLVYAMPLTISRIHKARVLTWASQPVGQYGDVLCDKSVSLDQWTNVALSFIKQQKQADLVLMRHVRATSNIGPHAENHFHDGKLYERAPAMNLTRFANEAEYDARYSSEQRHRRKRIRTKIEKIGALKFEVVGQNKVADAIDQALHEKLKWLTQRGRYNSAMHCPKHASFLKTLASQPTETLQTTTVHLSAGDQPISWEVSFIYQGTHYLYLTSHMAHLTDLSPGRLTFDLSQRHALSQGLKSYDLMIPYDHHKESWATQTEPVNDFYLPLNTYGAVYGHVYFGWLRPILRKIYLGLPMGKLKLLQKILRY